MVAKATQEEAPKAPLPVPLPCGWSHPPLSHTETSSRPPQTWVDSWLLLPFRKGTKVRGETIQSLVLSVTRSDRALEPSMGTWQWGREDRQRTETIQGLQHLLHPSPEICTFRALALAEKRVSPLRIHPNTNPYHAKAPDTRWGKNEFTGTSHKQIVLCGCHTSLNLF